MVIIVFSRLACVPASLIYEMDDNNSTYLIGLFCIKHKTKAQYYVLLRHMMKSVQFCHPVTSNFLRSHGLQHARLPCPLPTPRAYSNSCPSSWWSHPTISSSIIPFSLIPSNHLILYHPLFLLPSIFPPLGSFPMSQFFAWGGQSIGASASVLPINIQD